MHTGSGAGSLSTRVCAGVRETGVVGACSRENLAVLASEGKGWTNAAGVGGLE